MRTLRSGAGCLIKQEEAVCSTEESSPPKGRIALLTEHLDGQIARIAYLRVILQERMDTLQGAVPQQEAQGGMVGDRDACPRAGGELDYLADRLQDLESLVTTLYKEVDRVMQL